MGARNHLKRGPLRACTPTPLSCCHSAGIFSGFSGSFFAAFSPAWWPFFSLTACPKAGGLGRHRCRNDPRPLVKRRATWATIPSKTGDDGGRVDTRHDQQRPRVEPLSCMQMCFARKVCRFDISMLPWQRYAAITPVRILLLCSNGAVASLHRLSEWCSLARWASPARDSKTMHRAKKHAIDAKVGRMVTKVSRGKGI